MTRLRLRHWSSLTKTIALVNALLALVLGLTLWVSYQQHIKYAEEKVENITLILERSLSGTLDRIDLVLVSIIYELEGNLTRPAPLKKSAYGLIQRLAEDVPGLNVVSYTNAAGDVVEGVGVPQENSPINLQDRPYFQQLRDQHQSGMISSAPMMGRITGKSVIVFARPYKHPDGTFAGVVVASVATEQFTDMFAALKLGTDSAVTFIDPDYRIIARHPAPPDPSILGKPVQPWAIERLATGIERMTTVITSKNDGVVRQHAIRKLESKLYWITVGLSIHEELATWRKQVQLAIIVMLIFAVLTYLSGRQLQRSWRRQQEALSIMESTLEATDNGILVTSKYGTVMRNNHRFTKMWNIPDDLIASGDEKAMLNHVMGQLAQPETFIKRVEYIYNTPQDELFDLLTFKDGRVFERSSMPMHINTEITGRVWSFRDISERARIDGLISFIAQRSWVSSGRDFLTVLTERIAQLLKVNAVIIQKLSEDKHSLDVAAAYSTHLTITHLQTRLSDTPGEQVIGKELCFYRSGVRGKFPKDALLAELNAESYLALPLWDSAGRSIGLIATVDTHPMMQPSQASQTSVLLRLVAAAAAAAELERQREEKILRRERDRAQGYLDTVDAMIVVLDNVGKIVQINHKGCAILGWSHGELAGQDWFRKCLPEEAERNRLHADFLVLMAGKSGNAKYFENKILTKSGEQRLIAWHNALLRKDDGQIIGTLSAGEDITERNLRDQELKGYRHQLEQLVEARTRELEIAKDLAESSNRAKSVFLANMSHELRTPLNAILGFSRMLERDENISRQSAKKLAIINQSGQHLLALINDVLEISRIEAGRRTMHTEPFILAELLSSITNMVRPRAHSKGLRFVIHHEPDLPTVVEGDEQHLKQILINLLGNAVKYTEAGQIQFDIGRQTNKICFTISDTGPGITAEDQKRIFEPFYQTEDGVAKGEGSGLGLAISWEYTKILGGELELISESGKGCTFTLSIPLPATDRAVIRHPVGRVTGLATDQSTRRILVVDDQSDNRNLVQQLLEETGFEVATANNGEEAIALFKSWQPHLIWMDMRMPVVDGYEATRTIRNLPGGNEVKIVALTASAFDEDREAIIAAGCDDMVKKPLEEDLFFAAMSKLLDLHYEYAGEHLMALPVEHVDVTRLPEDLEKALQRAAEMLDIEAFHPLLLQVNELDPTLADHLQQLLENFRFDLIIQAIS